MVEVVKNRPQELTRAELEIMRVLWDKGAVVVHDILDEIPEPKPAYNTVSTIVRILEKKGFVSHKAYGKTYEYFPLVSKDDYASRYMDTVLDNFFGGSLSRLVSFFSQNKNISVEEADAILRMLRERK
ncbi:BlaI/MecI/CopY family transcriptional regulator [Alistipes sp.]|uniref:BlaI/MecI/CopY family transcriptional regulator n=1 Tax=Alistipes sp. TaxID=1872444 RepID=UPI003AF00503